MAGRLMSVGDSSFSRQLAISPVHAVRGAAFLARNERALLSETAATWAPHVCSLALGDALGAPIADANRAIRSLAEINRTTLNQLSHLVQPGESLASIAALYTGNPAAWTQLRDVNTLRESPRPGERLSLPVGWSGQFGNVTISAAQLQAHMERPPSALHAANPMNLQPRPTP